MYVKKSTFYRKKSTSKKSPAKKIPYKRKATVGTVKRIVKKEIAKNVENKHREVLNLGRNLYSSASGPFNASNVIQVSPGSTSLDIAQGTADGTRIGNRIKIKYLGFKGTLVSNTYDATVNPTPKPMQIKCFIFYERNDPSTFPPNPRADFLQFNSTTSALTNDLVDLWAPINNDKYRVLTSRTFKLGSSTYGQGAAIVGSINSNNDFKLNCNFRMNLTKYIPKLVRYNDNNTDPISRGLWAMFVPVWADGTQAPDTTLMATVSYSSMISYEDA